MKIWSQERIVMGSEGQCDAKLDHGASTAGRCFEQPTAADDIQVPRLFSEVPRCQPTTGKGRAERRSRRRCPAVAEPNDVQMTANRQRRRHRREVEADSGSRGILENQRRAARDGGIVGGERREAGANGLPIADPAVTGSAVVGRAQGNEVGWFRFSNSLSARLRSEQKGCQHKSRPGFHCRRGYRRSLLLTAIHLQRLIEEALNQMERAEGIDYVFHPCRRDKILRDGTTDCRY